jgi:hypothetical protein
MDELEIPAGQWLEVFEREYLASFVPEGGAVVKVLVAQPEPALEVVAALREVGRRNGLITAHVNQAVQRINHMDRLFNDVAKQTNWRDLASDCMRRQLAASGYRLPEGEPLIDGVASINGIDDVGQVRITVQQVVSNTVIRDYAMARDFRVAMGHMCRAVVERDDLLCDTANRIVDWLKGDLKTISALRSAMIFERINRYNARSMLASLGEWARLAGHAGLLVTVDVSRFAAGRSMAAPDGTEMRAPTLAAVMDTYELMRQCIDDTDELSGIAVCFIAGPEFVQDDRRGMRAYPALEQRLTDDVRDRRRGNPHAPMVRLAARWS